MGFDVPSRRAIIYDDGTQRFGGRTLEGIGQAIVGVMQHPDETFHRLVKVLSIEPAVEGLREGLKLGNLIKHDARAQG